MGLDIHDISIIESFSTEKTELGECYYDYYGLIKVIEFCKETSTPLLGVEGFDVTDEGFIPRSDAIADFSSLIKKDRTESTNKIIFSFDQFILTIENAKNMLWTVVL